MTHEYFKVSDADESVADLNETLKVELKMKMCSRATTSRTKWSSR